MTARWLAFVIWAAVAAAAVFWAFRLFVPALPAPAHTVTVGMAPSVKTDLRAVLGVEEKAVVVEAAVPIADARFQLVGVVSPRGTAGRGEGVALIAVDGKPARPYRVGTKIEEGVVLQARQGGRIEGRDASVFRRRRQPPGGEHHHQANDRHQDRRCAALDDNLTRIELGHGRGDSHGGRAPNVRDRG